MPDGNPWPFGLEDPYRSYHAARETAPVQWDDALGAYLVLSHEHSLAVLRNPTEWSSDPRNSPELVAGRSKTGPFFELLAESLLMSDPPTHTRLRSAVNRFFTPRVVQRIGGRIAAIVESAFASLADGRPIELMADLAYPIPLAVIAELFDVGLEGAELLREQTPMLARILELDPMPEEIEAADAAAMTVVLFLVPLIAERRIEPGDDLLSALIHPPDGGMALRVEEIVSMCLILLAAGHETTANLIGNGTLALLEHPDQLEWLARHPELCSSAVEELLRYDSPVQVAGRIAHDDLMLGGVEVHRGSQALVVIGAANRDPSRYLDPDRLNLQRSGPPHLAFGNGPHYCIGAGLARLEAKETFNLLAKRLIPRSGDWSYSRDRSHTFRRLRELHITALSTSTHALDPAPVN